MKISKCRGSGRELMTDDESLSGVVDPLESCPYPKTMKASMELREPSVRESGTRIAECVGRMKPSCVACFHGCD